MYDVITPASSVGSRGPTSAPGGLNEEHPNGCERPNKRWPPREQHDAPGSTQQLDGAAGVAEGKNCTSGSNYYNARNSVSSAAGAHNPHTKILQSSPRCRITLEINDYRY